MIEPAESLLLSACLGALVGLIRQWEVQHEPVPDAEFAGLRTFTLVALLGCVSASVAGSHAPGAFVGALLVLGLLLVVNQWPAPGSSSGPAGRRGYTTSAAAVATFFAGGLVSWQERPAAVVLAALTALLLGLKQPIHRWTERFTAQDVRSALQFLAITGVILPLVPNHDYGPYGAFNPWATWLMVVLISGLGFLGYLLMRLLGPRAGITLTGLVGGLASSTATTLAFSRRSREEPAQAESHALAVILACLVMLGRVLAIALALAPALARALVPALVLMAVPGLAYAAWLATRRRTAEAAVEAPRVTNPLSLATAVKFAVAYAVVKFLVRAASQAGAAQGVVVISGVAGLTDVDAIAVSLSDGVHAGGLELGVATTAVVVGCVSNTLVKAGIAAVLGDPRLRVRVVTVLGATALVGLGGLLLGS